MLCLKKKKFWGSSSSYGPQSQSKSFGLEQGNGISSEDGKRRVTRNNSRATDMAPPPTATQAVHPVVREVTEDTPPDLLEGTMDLMAVLPSGKTVQTTVDRKTPMMDLYIHIATANKINPAGHIVQVRNERGIEMPYKPSTPIGALDTTTIEIVPKNRVNEYIIVKKPAKVANQPFETTFKLQVHLPRNQLYVIRISPRTVLDDILREVCQEKNLDISKYEIRHPVHLDQKLPLSATVGETGLQEITVVSKNHKINSSVSTADIIAILQQQSDGKGCLDGSFKHSRSSVGDSSVSSESTASGSGSGRGISPCRSEDSRSISPLPLIRPKTLFPSRTTSNISTCSSSGNSSGIHSKSKTLQSSLSMSSQISHQEVVMQAPPRTKKRAAPKPPASTPDSRANSVNSPVSEKGTPLPNNADNSSRTSGTPLEKPAPRKKEAPREPPKQHAPLSHHQSLPINQCRQQEVASFQQNRQDFRQLDRLRKKTCLSVVITVHFVSVIASAIYTNLDVDLAILKLMTQLIFTMWGLYLFGSFLYAGKRVLGAMGESRSSSNEGSSLTSHNEKGVANLFGMGMLGPGQNLASSLTAALAPTLLQSSGSTTASSSTPKIKITDENDRTVSVASDSSRINDGGADTFGDGATQPLVRPSTPIAGPSNPRPTEICEADTDLELVSNSGTSSSVNFARPPSPVLPRRKSSGSGRGTEFNPRSRLALNRKDSGPGSDIPNEKEIRKKSLTWVEPEKEGGSSKTESEKSVFEKRRASRKSLEGNSLNPSTTEFDRASIRAEALLTGGGPDYTLQSILSHIAYVNQTALDYRLSRKLSRKNQIHRVIKYTAMTAVLGVLLCVMELIRILSPYGMFASTTSPPSPWPWFALQTCCRLVEIVMGATVANITKQPVSRPAHYAYSIRHKHHRESLYL